MRINAKREYLTFITCKNRGVVDLTSTSQRLTIYKLEKRFSKINQVFNKILVNLLLNSHPKDYKIYSLFDDSFWLYNTKSFVKKGEFKTLVDCEVAIRLMEGGYF